MNNNGNVMNNEFRNLIRTWIPINKRNNSGRTLLMRASYERRPRIVRELLRAGADPNARGLGSRTALMYAALVGSIPIARMLIQAGADVNARAPDGTTVITTALQGPGATIAPMLHLLIQSGARINSNSNRAMHIALEGAVENTGPNANIVRLLIHRGARVTKNMLNYARRRQTVFNAVLSALQTRRIAKKVVRRAETSFRHRRAGNLLTSPRLLGNLEQRTNGRLPNIPPLVTRRIANFVKARII